MLHTVPNKILGNNMGNDGPYLVNTWEWYGWVNSYLGNGDEFCNFCCYENCMERKLLFCPDMDQIFNKKNVTLLGSNSDKRHAGVTQRLRTAEMVTNDTKMCLQCKSDGEKCKHNSILTAAWLPPQYAKWKVLKFRLGTSVTPPPSPPD